MTSYNKGRRFEYATRHFLEKKGWVVFRSAGSKGVADLVALRAGEIWLVQCKLNGWMSPAERLAFSEVARELGVVPMIAFKEKRKLILQEVTDGTREG